MDEQSWKEVPDDTSTSTSTENRPTPTTTPSTGSESKHRRELQPGDGGLFLIRTRQEPHLYLSLSYGKLEILPLPTGGSYWECVKKDGWFGLRNTVSGGFISHDNKGRICVKDQYLTSHEYFTDCRHPDGGYILKQLKTPTNELEESILKEQGPLGCILKHFMGRSNELMEVSISKDEESLVHQREGGTAWDFIDEIHIRQYTWLYCPGMKSEEIRSLPG
ncbi:hypothetical protein MKX08_006857 [Trichoderma sp. CBMAI-0020]|nr:hypothetical protein MKX08_006857 [Trichoderma sp. CBMAI-0020]